MQPKLRSIIIYSLLTVFLVGSTGAAVYFFLQYQKVSERLKNPQAEVKELLLQVGKLMELPEGEEPTVATVTDVERLKVQPFFAKAKNGDRVIIYTNARLAILFDAKANKIINVGALNVAPTTATPSAQTPSDTTPAP